MTTIAWTTESWNPIRATDPATGKKGWYCQKVSPGCFACYAQAMNRYRGNGRRYDVRGGAGLEIAIDPAALAKPLKQWKKNGRRIFVCSMTDLFLEQHTDDMIDQVFAVMALSPQHTFQVLTKRPERMLKYLTDETLEARRGHLLAGVGERIELAMFDLDPDAGEVAWPLPNVWLGVSAEDQERADERIPLLLETPAAVRWVSYEPALGPINFLKFGVAERKRVQDVVASTGQPHRMDRWVDRLDWVVPGGESGPGARPFDPIWAYDTIRQCRGTRTKVFVKQMGSAIAKRDGYADSKGEDPNEWPEQLRVREYPR